MKKLTLMLVLVNAFIWAIFLPLKVLADDTNASKGVVISTSEYNTAVIGHVIKENISGNGVDTSVLEAEMAKLAYQFSLEMTSVVEKHLPNILEAIANEIRLKADSEYKCSLLKDSKIKDKECS